MAPAFVESTSPLSLAVVLRGTAYRFGCDILGVVLQDHAMRSMHTALSQPLEARGHQVNYFMPLYNASCADDSLWNRLVAIHGTRVRVATKVLWSNNGYGQGAGVRVALNLFMPYASSYAVMLLVRYDAAIIAPIDGWPCRLEGSDWIGLAGPCERETWMQWNCTNDMLWIVPSSRFISFNQSVGKSGKKVTYVHTDSKTHRKTSVSLCPSDCFEKLSHFRHSTAPLGAGHGCYNQIGRRIGYSHLEFCWAHGPNSSVIGRNVLSGNDFFKLPKRLGRSGPSLALYVFNLGLLSLNESAAAALTRASLKDEDGTDPRIRVTTQTYQRQANAWWEKYILTRG